MCAPCSIFLAVLCLFGFAVPASFADSGLLDLAEREFNPWKARPERWLVFFFVRADCPISNRYAPEVSRLHAEFAKRGVAFWLVYCDPDESATAIVRHSKEYRYPFAALRDPRKTFARRSRISITPEAALYSTRGELLYHGRIDDRFVDFGKERAAPTRRELRDALSLALAGKRVAVASAPGVGCPIEGVE
jgi:hypothetical protein